MAPGSAHRAGQADGIKLQLPEDPLYDPSMPTLPGSMLRYEVPLKIEFEVHRLRRDDPREAWLIRQILAVFPPGADVSGPIDAPEVVEPGPVEIAEDVPDEAGSPEQVEPREPEQPAERSDAVPEAPARLRVTIPMDLRTELDDVVVLRGVKEIEAQ